jgi:hypothetical protein
MVHSENKIRPAKFTGVSGSSIRNMHKIMIIVDDYNLGIIEKINYHREWGFQIIYILTDSAAIKAQFQYRSRVYSIKANIRSLLRHDIVDEIVCCVSSLPDGYLKELSEICRQFGVSLLALPSVDNSGLLSPSLTSFQYVGNDAKKQAVIHIEIRYGSVHGLLSTFNIVTLSGHGCIDDKSYLQGTGDFQTTSGWYPGKEILYL